MVNNTTISTAKLAEHTIVSLNPSDACHRHVFDYKSVTEREHQYFYH